MTAHSSSPAGDSSSSASLTTPVRQQLFAELDAMLTQVRTLIQQFENTGFTVPLRDDYIALHRLEMQMLEAREQHRQALIATEGANAGGERAVW